MPLIVSLLWLICGLLLMYFPPKKINNFYGYRTKRSMSSQRNWDFAQKYSAKLTVLCGLYGSVVCGIALVIEHYLQVRDSETEMLHVILTGVIVAIMAVITFLPTEKRLAKLQDPTPPIH